MEFGILHSSSTIAIGRAVREFRVQVLVLVQSGLHLYFVSQSVFYFFSSPTGSRVHAIIVQPLFNCVEILYRPFNRLVILQLLLCLRDFGNMNEKWEELEKYNASVSLYFY